MEANRHTVSLADRRRFAIHFHQVITVESIVKEVMADAAPGHNLATVLVSKYGLFL